MRHSTVCLISGIVCFVAGAAIFALALFGRMLDPEIGGGIGSSLIFIFLILMMVTVMLRNKERSD